MIHYLKLFNRSLTLLGSLLLLTTAAAWAASQSFSVLNGTPQNGMLMSSTANPGVAALATTGTASSLIGVVSPEGSDIEQQAGQFSVQTDGVAQALVSTLDGDILVGDRITASPVEGVGTKAVGNAWIVGVAQASFDSHSSGALQTTITDANGVQHTYYVGRIPLAIKVTYYSTNQNNSAWVPQALQRIADSLAGRHVSTRALLLGSLLFLVGLVAAGMITFSAIHGSFNAIARQPLAKFVILRQQSRSLGIAALILIVSLGAAFVLLKLF